MSSGNESNLFRQSDAVEVRRVTNRGKGGRGVFAVRDLPVGETFERVPVLLIPRTQVFGNSAIAARAARVSWYVFRWIHNTRGYVALALGYGSLYNHSETPNARYRMLLPDIMEFFALREIAAGDEITIDYRGETGDPMEGVGFTVLTDPAKTAQSHGGGDAASVMPRP